MLEAQFDETMDKADDEALKKYIAMI